MDRTWRYFWWIVVLAFASCFQFVRAESFKSGKLVPVANGAAYVLAGDVNGDGKPDLVYLTIGSSAAAAVIDVALGNGDGSFAAPKPIPAVPTSMGFLSQFAIADVNQDGKLDLIVIVNSVSPTSTLGIFLGNGDGTFQSALFSAGPTNNVGDPLLNGHMGIGDFDGDGVVDIVIADAANDTLSFLKGDNQGHFALRSTWSDLNNPHDVHAADLNGDGHLDLVAQGLLSATVSVYIGNGDGTFQPRVSYTGPHNAGAVVVRDMNNDGRPDLVVSGFNNTVDILLNHGDGTFSNTSGGGPSNAGFEPAVFAVEDFDGDGTLDLATSSPDGIEILRGLGSLAYASPKVFPAGALSFSQAPNLPAVADFDGDGHLDFALPTGDGIALLFGRPGGTLLSADAYDTTYQVTSVTAGDFNGDKIPDLAIGVVGRTPRIATGKGDGTFNLGTDQTQSLGNAFTTSVTAADFDGDHKTDVLIEQTDSLLEIGNGDGTFAPPTAFMPGGISGTLFIADFNNDGVEDFATYTGQGVIFLTAKPDHSYAQFNANLPPVSGLFIGNFAFADVNNDGKIDAIFHTDSPAYTAVYLGNGDGTFVTGPFYATSTAATASFALGDVDGDGNIDIIVATGISGQSSVLSMATGIGVFYGNGDGTFQPQVSVPTAHSVAVIAAGDLSQDGIADVVTSDATVVTVMNGTRARAFEKSRDYLAGNAAVSPLLIDLNGDGGLDLVFANAQVNAVSTATVLLNLGVTTGTLTANPNPTIYGQPVTLSVSFAPTIAIAGVPMGTVSFVAGGAALGSGTLQSGAASVTAPALAPVGTQTLKAVWAGDDTFNAHTLSTMLTITKANSSVTLSAAPAAAVVGQKVTLTAHVSAQFAGVPTGTVSFQQGAGAASVVNVDATGSATLVVDTSKLAVGNYSYTASYSGDTNFTASSAGSAAQFTVTDFHVTASPVALTVSAGGSGTANVNVVSTTGFNGSVDLSCSGLPATAQCSFAPASVSLANATSASSMMTVTASGVATVPEMGWRWPAAPFGPAGLMVVCFAAILAFSGFLLAGFEQRNTTVLVRLSMAVLLTCAGYAFAGCGGGGGGGGNAPTPVTYTVQVVATVHGSAPAIVRSVNVSVTVQP